MPASTLNAKIVKPPSLRHVVCERLREAILSGRIPKGTRLYESQLAKEMGISRTPIREALHVLEREMLLSAVDKVGYLIQDADPADLEEISEIRKTVECLAVRKAVEHCGAEDLEKLERNLDRSEKALKDGRVEAFIVLDAEFHHLLCSLSGSQRLIRMAEMLRKEMQRFRSRARSLEPLAAASLRYHKRMIPLLKNKDLESLTKILGEHIEDVKNEIGRNAPGLGAASPIHRRTRPARRK
jgi:GntR family transcriptional regulator, rspAB operon transcriptional repressor